MLDRHGVSNIDLLSLDLEGYEPSALRGLDLRRHTPKFIVIEAWNEPAIDDLLLGRYEKLGRLCATSSTAAPGTTSCTG